MTPTALLGEQYRRSSVRVEDAGGTGSHGRPGSLTPEARRQLDESLAAGITRHAAGRRGGGPAAAVPARDFPYPDLPAAQVAAYRRAAARTAPRPVYHPAAGAAPATAPIPVLPVNAAVAPVRVYTTDPVDLARAAQLLQQVDFEAVDAAKVEGAIYAEVCAARERQAPPRPPARGPVPFHDALLKERGAPLGDPARPAWRPPAGRVRRHGDAALRRLGDLKWPAVSGFTAPGADDLYAELLRRVSVITGTTGTGNWLPAHAAGGAR